MSAVGQECDVLIVGAGPAGLAAALYLARYRRRALVVHDGTSRAARIPLSYNLPGFPGGITGPDLLQRMQEQAALYGALFAEDRIERLHRSGGAFEAMGKGRVYKARAVILATGVSLNQVELVSDVHEEAISQGCLRYCPICDGYEASNKAVAVLGSSTHGAREALFLRQYTDRVSLLAQETCELSAGQRDDLAAAGVTVIDTPVMEFRPAPDGMSVVLADGQALRFAVLYPALGVQPRSELAVQLGIELSEGGCIPTDAHQAVSMACVYAAGDVVDALDQISVAIGHGAVAATQAHNDLCDSEGRTLQSR